MTSSSIADGFSTQPMKMQVAAAMIGISTEFVMKSKKSRNWKPAKVSVRKRRTSPQGPYPSAENVERNRMIAPVKNVAALRWMCSRSQNEATHAS